MNLTRPSRDVPPIAAAVPARRTALLWAAFVTLLLAMLAGPAVNQASAARLYDDGPLSADPGGLAPRFLLKSTWPTKEITFAFINGTADIPGDDEHEAVRKALQLWSTVTPLTFHEVSPANAEIRISWENGDHGDGYPFDGPGNTLAHAYYPGASPINGDIHFDDAETWTTSLRSTHTQPIDLESVAAHEIGHALGLDHSTDPDALMYPYYSESHRFLGADDIAGIQAAYGTRPGPRFFLRNGNGEGLPSSIFGYGDPGDLPLVGDWNANGTDTGGLYRPSTRTFYLNDQNDDSAAEHTTTYGNPGDVPLVGDWNGDGTDTIGVYNPGSRTFSLNDQVDTSAPEHAATYGDPGDVPLVGDWNGDGKDTIGLYRPSTRAFYLNDQVDASAPEYAYTFGNPGDVPVVGDWNGDGADEVGVYRPSTREWGLRSGHGASASATSFRFGALGDLRPITGDWNGDGITTVGFRE